MHFELYDMHDSVCVHMGQVFIILCQIPSALAGAEDQIIYTFMSYIETTALVCSALRGWFTPPKNFIYST